MGLFSKIKKGLKKVFNKVKKVVKQTVKRVKKVVKKIGSSKILKALAIAAAVVVTGGAALTAFGGTGALASSQFGSWMMSASQNILGGTAFGSAAGKKFIPKILTQTGNFLAKTAAKPFGAVGGALGSTARVGTNILTGKSAFAAGPAGAAPTPFSGEALTGQKSAAGQYVDEKGLSIDLEAAKEQGITFDVEQSKQFEKALNVGETASPESGFWQSGAGETIKNIGTSTVTNVASGVLTGAAMEYIQGDPEQQGSMSGAAYEGSEFMDPLKVYAAQQGISTDSIYEHMMYGNVDPSTLYGNELYRQQTIGVA